MSMADKPQPIEFLSKATPSRLRKEIQNICDSYSHPWDVLAELCQNSVDAIALHKKRLGETKRKHKIEITINALERSVEVYDTGLGFHPEKLVDLMAPHETDKELTDPVIGQKGVGLTYTVFISNYYRIESHSTFGLVAGRVE